MNQPETIGDIVTARLLPEDAFGKRDATAEEIREGKASNQNY
jgi:hypothetical protein